MRSTPAMRERYFGEDAGSLVVGEKLRSLVGFARHNLVSDPFPPLGRSAVQLILCRNVLIYFDGQVVGRVLDSSSTLSPARARSSSEWRMHSARPRVASQALQRSRRPSIRNLTSSGTSCAARSGDCRLPARSSVPSQRSTTTRSSAAAYFRRGLTELESDDPAAAVNSLRRALYVEPRFGLAAFKLGGALETLGDVPAARRAYEQALRALEPDERHEALLAQIDLADVARAARARLGVLAAASDAGAGTPRRAPAHR